MGDFILLFVNYCVFFVNFVVEGIIMVCYNFMLIFDWMCIDFVIFVVCGGSCLYFLVVKMVVFEVYMFGWDGVVNDYIFNVI